MDKTVRIVVIGDSKCGKTSLIRKWTEAQYNGNEPQPDANGLQSVFEVIDLLIN